MADDTGSEEPKDWEVELEEARATGDRLGEANAHNGLGELALRTGDSEAARDHFEAALTICVEIRDRPGEVNAHNGLGDVALRTGDPEAARV